MTIYRNTNSYSVRITSGHPPVRPESFAWTEEEAIVIFGPGLSAPNHARTPTAEEDPVLPTRILLAGRNDQRFSDVRSALATARDSVIDRFVVIERSAQFYMQALCIDAGWVLEKREGHGGAHFRAEVLFSEPETSVGDDPLMAQIFPAPQKRSLYLTFEQIAEAISCYQRGMPEPQWLHWARIDVS